MKRDPALVPLTHDHHHALRQARTLRLAAGADQAMQQDAARTFIAFYRGETIPHFREEEELLFPLLVDVTATVPDLLKQILVEHVQLHSMVRRLGMALETHSTEGALLIEVGVLLEAHIRREEGELFPLIEQVVLPAALAGLTLGARVRADPATLPPD